MELDRSGSRIRVLFLCTGNSCRSQMAEGWVRELKPHLIEAHSAGTQPQGLNLLAVRAMTEVGVNISTYRSKHIDEFASEKFDYVVTVCDSAHESCPAAPGFGPIVHMGFDDPPRLALGARDDEEAMTHYRRVRDEIRGFVAAMPEALHRLAETRRSARGDQAPGAIDRA